MMNEYTEESLFDGDLLVRQRRNGYRFSIDPVLLSHYARPGRYDSVLDLGTGCGIIPLLLTYRHPDITVAGVEIQPELSGLAGLNIQRNTLCDRIRIVPGNMLAVHGDLPPESFDLIVTNPPYTKKNSGRINPRCQKAVARHELEMTLDGLLETSTILLKPGGRFALVYPALRLAELLTTMQARCIEPKRLRMVHPRAGGGAKLVLVEGIKNGRSGVEVEAPLFIYKSGTLYSREVEKMFQKD